MLFRYIWNLCLQRLPEAFWVSFPGDKTPASNPAPALPTINDEQSFWRCDTTLLWVMFHDLCVCLSTSRHSSITLYVPKWQASCYCVAIFVRCFHVVLDNFPGCPFPLVCAAVICTRVGDWAPDRRWDVLLDISCFLLLFLIVRYLSVMYLSYNPYPIIDSSFVCCFWEATWFS